MMEQQDSALPVTPERGVGRPVGPTPRHRLILSILALLMLVAGILMVRGWRPGSSGSADGAVRSVPSSPEIEDAYGVRIVGVDVTAAGGMIQIRYQVIDPDKVDAIHEGEAAPVVVGSDGHVYADPAMAGHSHIGRIGGAGSTNTILLANSGGGVRRGGTVTVRVGDLELHGVPVS